MLLLLVNKCYQTQLHGTSTPSNTKLMILILKKLTEFTFIKSTQNLLKNIYLKKINKLISLNIKA